MRIINTQYNENNQPISTLWVNEKGEYLIEKNGIFTPIVESVKPKIVELSQDQINNLRELYKKEMLSLPLEDMDERLKSNPIKNLGDEVVNKIR